MLRTGQSKDSNCIDAGQYFGHCRRGLRITHPNDGVFDISTVDMGYHYSKGLAEYQIT